ncbi:MAG TPA: SH3 domain-containing protein [Kofleriaceae bacterium]|nr:SH3 domain-containing protein [Kofleriaceae bacterium]
MFRVLSLAIALIAVGADLAAAEPRHTLEAVAVRKKPGEKEQVVGNLPANTEIVVLAEEGRWLRVRAGSVTGYITRTTASEPAAAPSPEVGRWSAARHTNELLVQVMKPTAFLHDPKPGAAKLGDLAPGAKLTVIDAATTAGWIEGRDDQGQQGWVAREAVDNGASAVAVAGTDLRGLGMTRDAYTRAKAGKLAVRASVGFGYRSLSMNESANADGGLTNYLLTSDAYAGAIDGDARLALTARWLAGADLHVEGSDSSPGIGYGGPTSPPGKIPFTTADLDVGVRAGVHVHDAIDIAVRAGGHYDAFLPSSVDNVGMLPRERLLGATLGARFAAVPLHSRFDASAGFDVMVVGSRAQTPGLQDGTASSAHAVWGHAMVRYELARRIAVFSAYDFGYATTDWTGMSVREPGVTKASRADTSQLLELGVSTAL